MQEEQFHTTELILKAAKKEPWYQEIPVSVLRARQEEVIFGLLEGALKPDHSVLEVRPRPGNYTVPIARRCRDMVAIDHSPKLRGTCESVLTEKDLRTSMKRLIFSREDRNMLVVQTLKERVSDAWLYALSHLRELTSAQQVRRHNPDQALNVEDRTRQGKWSMPKAG